MALIRTAGASNLDMYETAIGSLLTPSFTLVNGGQVHLSFAGGFSAILEGRGFALSAGGALSGGTITRVSEYRNGALGFTLEGVELSAGLLAQWLEQGDYEAFLRHVLGGADTVLGGGSWDRIFTGDGDDVIRAGAGDDEIDGGAGVDTAVFGGAWRRSTLTGEGAEWTVSGPDGVDSVFDVERFEFADGTLVLDPDAAGAAVQRLYGAVLGRSADQAGLEHWLDRLDEGGLTLNDVAAAFLGSPEFRAAGADVAGNGAFADFLYRSVLGRAPDAGGRADWVARLDAGLARADALLFFAESNEHKARTAGLTAQGYFETDDSAQTVALLYDSFLDRLPDAPGLGHWVEQLKTGARTLDQVAASFANSAEFRNKTAGLSDAALVDYLYGSTLDRAAAPSERSHWLGELARGVTKTDMALFFATSPEHALLIADRITGGVDVLL